MISEKKKWSECCVWSLSRLVITGEKLFVIIPIHHVSSCLVIIFDNELLLYILIWFIILYNILLCSLLGKKILFGMLWLDLYCFWAGAKGETCFFGPDGVVTISTCRGYSEHANQSRLDLLVEPGFKWPGIVLSGVLRIMLSGLIAKDIIASDRK